MPWNCFSDFAIEHWLSAVAPEPGLCQRYWHHRNLIDTYLLTIITTTVHLLGDHLESPPWHGQFYEIASLLMLITSGVMSTCHSLIVVWCNNVTYQPCTKMSLVMLAAIWGKSTAPITFVIHLAETTLQTDCVSIWCYSLYIFPQLNRRQRYNPVHFCYLLFMTQGLEPTRCCQSILNVL